MELPQWWSGNDGFAYPEPVLSLAKVADFDELYISTSESTCMSNSIRNTLGQ